MSNSTIISIRPKKKFIFTDEAHFHLVGTLKSKLSVFGTQKTYAWSYNSHLKSDWLVVLVDRRRNWPTFFENEHDLTVTGNGNTNYTMINDSFMHALHVVDMNDVLFHWNGATCHISLDIIDVKAAMVMSFENKLQFNSVGTFSVGRR